MAKKIFPIIEKLGGNRVVYAKLGTYGYEASTYDAVRMWGAGDRGRIPGWATLILMKIAQDEGIEFSANDFEFQDG